MIEHRSVLRLCRPHRAPIARWCVWRAPLARAIAWRACAALCAAAPLATGGLAAAPAVADRSFTPRFSANASGDVTIVGNTLETCARTDAACAAAQANRSADNNGFVMGRVNDAAEAKTFDSSSAELSLPAGARVLFAGLYFGARTSAGSGGAKAPDSSPAARRSVDFRAPGAGGYEHLTAVTLDDSDAVSGAYQAFADVTARVRRAGAGDYAVANVQSATGLDRYAGWALVVAYAAPGEPARNLTIFDGLTAVTQGQPAVTIPIDGFQTPPSGPVKTELGFVAYEGDGGAAGDSAALNGRTLADGANLAGNFFNSAISLDGRLVRAKTPDYANQLGFDIKRVNADGLLLNDDSSAQIQLRTNKDQYLPGVVTFATELYAPQILAEKSVSDLTHPGGAAEPGDLLRYTLSLRNEGLDDAQRLTVEDVLPPALTFVPRSLEVGGVSASDDAGDDLGEYDAAARAVRFQLGAGATPQGGGTLAARPPASRVAFSARVGASAQAGEQITNFAEARFAARTLGSSLSALSNPATVQVSRRPAPAPPQADLSSSQSDTVAPDAAGEQVTDTIVITNHGPDDATNVTLSDPLGDGTLEASAGDSAGCEQTALALTCTLGRLDAGASAEVELVEQLGATPDAARPLSEPDVSSDELDPNPANNAARPLEDPPLETSANAATGTPGANLEISEHADRADDALGSTLAYTITVRNDGPGEASGIELTDVMGGAAQPLAVTPAAAGCAAELPLHCALPPLAAGAEEQLTLSVRPLTPGVLQSTASVSDDEPTSAPAADSTGARTSIRDRTATVGVGALVAPGLVLAGGTLRFHFELANGAVVPGVHVRVCNQLGGELALVSAPHAHLSAHEACWSIPSLVHGTPRHFALTARVAPGADPGAVLHDSVRVTGANVIAHSVDVSARVLAPLSACAARAPQRPARAHASC